MKSLLDVIQEMAAENINPLLLNEEIARLEQEISIYLYEAGGETYGQQS